MKRVAAIDIGTNTFLCLIADVENGRVVRTISDRVKIVRLGEGVHKNREFLPAAIARARECLMEFKAEMDQYGVEKVAAVATSAARDVKNSQDLFDIGRQLNIPIQIIEGKKEAELTFAGVLTNPKFDDNVAVIDVGGGSTEVTYKNENGEVVGKSLDMGGVRLTEMFISEHPVSSEELETLREYAREKLTVFPKLKNKVVVGVAGTPTTLAALEQKIDYTEERIEGFYLSNNELQSWVSYLAGKSIEERSKMKGLEPKRADIIVAGSTILLEAVKALGGEGLKVSTRGVRYGLAAELGR